VDDARRRPASLLVRFVNEMTRRGLPGSLRPVETPAAGTRPTSTSRARRGAAASAPVPERAELEELRHAVYVLTTAERRLAQRYKRSGQNRGPGRLNLLSYLAVEEEATHGQLARYCNLNPATMTVLLDQLMEQGHVQRRQDDVDRRVWWISLTPDGLRAIDEIKAEWHQRLSEVFATTSDRDLKAARRIIEQVAEVFDSMGDA